ncbi:MAG TPA: polyphenol oxidase family protein [Acidimicrobiales bacterium]|nr:polyphenol oxidase family protein [Acidimicrobiales bacterium]
MHGARVVRVTQPGEHAGVDADAAVTNVTGAKLAVRTADCVPLVLEADGAIGVVHAGWRGLAAGIVEAAIAQLGTVRRVRVGPHIRVGCYEFGTTDLDEVAAALGEGVRGRTTWGTPALDLTAAVRTAVGVAASIDDGGACTACSDLYFSWRARRDTARFATIAWMS